MSKDFKEWWENYKESLDVDAPDLEEIAQEAFEAGKESQQSKIDSLLDEINYASVV